MEEVKQVPQQIKEKYGHIHDMVVLLENRNYELLMPSAMEAGYKEIFSGLVNKNDKIN